jgi:hypothetical protein
MSNSLKWLQLASLTNLVSNALQQNLAGDFGGFLNGQDVLRDFLGLKGTALSAPLSFMLIQLGLTILAQRPGRSGRVGVGGLAFVGLFYTLAQVGEPIGLRLLRPSAFDLAQFIVFLVNVVSAIAMLVFGVIAWRKMRVSAPIMGEP